MSVSDNGSVFGVFETPLSRRSSFRSGRSSNRRGGGHRRGRDGVHAAFDPRACQPTMVSVALPEPYFEPGSGRAVAPLLGSVFLLHEDRAAQRLPLGARCREMWRLMQSRVVWQVLAFELVAAFCLSFSSAAGVAVETSWAAVQPFHKSLAALGTGLVYTGALYATKVYLLEVSWQARRWFLWDPPGLVIAGFAWCVMLAALAALSWSVSLWLGALSPAGLLLELWFAALLGMCMWCHLAVMTTDPGAVPAKLTGVTAGGTRAAQDKGERKNPGGVEENEAVVVAKDDDDDEFEEYEVEIPLAELESHEDDGSLLLFCDECAIYRPARAEHCSTCARCITLHDHHCPWVNNCVGIGNQKAFLLLLAYVTATSVHAALFIGAQMALCSGRACGLSDGERPGTVGVWVLAGACVFGLFCSLMLAMELYSIQLEPLFSRIASELRGRHGCKSRSRLERHLSVVCGTNGFSLTWLVPVAPRRSRREEEVVLGYRAGAAADVC
ncbi:hypothetical protein PybrP1_005798 [[Pythium] brassicae (nom. inval.)]|nr:hypothetical protein PybrP1_005798 [[Pythium] brassicae (nom. inval.)]